MVLNILLAAVACAWVVWDVTRSLRIAKQLRGDRIVTCPETGRPAVVAIDVRWAERGRCDEPCIGEAATPTSTPLAIVKRVLEGKACVFCRKPIEHVAFLDHYPALLQADGTTIAWPEVPVERLRESLTDRPWTRI